MLVFALNPYFHLVATHFYTDALYLLLVVLITTRAASGSCAWSALVLAPLTRQFGVMYPIGSALEAFWARNQRRALCALLTLLPTLALFALWRALAPDCFWSEVARSVHAEYGPIFPYITAYELAAFGFYLSPAALLVERTRSFWLGAAVGAALYALAPAHPNFSSLLAESDNRTLGLVHSLAMLTGPRAAHAVLFALSFLGGGLLAKAVTVATPQRAFLILFFLISPLNFQAWDKYLLELIPAALLALSAASRSNEVAGRAGSERRNLGRGERI